MVPLTVPATSAAAVPNTVAPSASSMMKVRMSLGPLRWGRVLSREAAVRPEAILRGRGGNAAGLLAPVGMMV